MPLRRLIPWLLLAALAPAGAGARPLPADVHELLERVLQAYGGREALSSVHAYRAEGSVFSAMRHESAPTVRVFARPDRFKALIEYEGAAEARVADGTLVWRNEPGGSLERAEGPMWAAVVLQAARAGLPWLLMEREDDVRVTTDDAPDVFDDQARPDRNAPLIGLELPLRTGVGLRLWVDPRSFRVVVSQGLLDHAGMRTHFATVYGDFRRVGGVLFPFHEDNWAEGMQTGITTLDRVVIDPPLRADEFRPRGPGADSDDGS